MKDDYTAAKKLALGGFAGAVAKTCVAPLERVRIVAQTQVFTGNLKGSRTLAKEIVKKTGIIGMWRGNLINVMRVVPHKAILFSFNDFINEFARAKLANRVDNFFLSFASGSMAGVFATLMTFPLDVYRTRVASDMNAKTKYSSIINFVTSTYYKEGLRGFYRGVTPTALGAIPYEGIKFAVFDMLKKFNFFDESVVPSSVKVVIDGAIAGSIAGVVMYPNDTVRRLLQMQGVDKNRQYNGLIDCWKKTFAEGGVKRFFRGVVPYTIRLAPNSAIQFSIYEGFKGYM